MRVSISFEDRSVEIELGMRMKLEMDPYEEPLPVIGTIEGIEIGRRKSVEIGQDAFYALVKVRQNEQQRVFDLQEKGVFIVAIKEE
jgi:hypothetical protein